MVERIVVAGAGSIGCFVGGLLAAAGRDVVLLARPRIAEELGAHGLTLTSFEGWKVRLAPGAVEVQTDPAEALARATLVLVSVKSGATVEMGRLIAAHAPPSATIVSLQNGLDNAGLLRAEVPGRAVLAGMVSFNVLHLGEGRFHRGTSGPILIEAGGASTPDTLSVPHLEVAAHPRMEEVLAGKLVYNLNNALNALSGLTLHEQLAQRAWRLLLADCQEEALAVFRAKGIRPWSLGKLPVTRFPRILRLPDLLFRLIVSRGVKIDATARSSMWEDLERGRTTEIGELQGKVVDLARELGLPAPANALILEEIRRAERDGRGSPCLQPNSLRQRTAS